MGCKIISFFCVLLFVVVTGSQVTFTPSKYNLKIETSDKNFKDDAKGDDLRFAGEVIIEFKIVATPPKDILGQRVLIPLNTSPNMSLAGNPTFVLEGEKEGKGWENIGSAKILTHKEDKVTAVIEEYDPTFVNYRMTLRYTELLRNDMTGFYRSSYVGPDGKTRWLLTTHFEPVYARKAFPCFDRPDLKAKFTIHITAPQDKETVLSNNPKTSKPVTTITSEGNVKTYTFEETLPMSTYLVAFTISDFKGTTPAEFESNYPTDLDKKRFLTTYGREEIINKGDGNLAQTAGLAAIKELQNYLGLGYAFKKVDQVGIPDFSAGAMENWGHISFREKSLFFNEKTGSTLTKQANVLTITHELVHQWFGNLVTLESWDYIWLNEAFANYLEYVIASKFQGDSLKSSEWELMKQFVVSEMHSRAFETDGLNSAKALNNKITDESLILPSFNDIPYSKGASVLRMWNMVLGNETFQKTLQKYVEERKLKSANSAQLLEHFKKEAKMEEVFFTTWTEQPGYPVVEVKKTEKTGEYELSQKRFLWEESKSDSKWYIPITVSNASDKFDLKPIQVLHKEPLKMNITGKWFVVNNQQMGYYRVNYPKENWEALAKVLIEKPSDIHEMNRAQIVNDVYSLARSLQDNYVSYETALNLTSYLKKEKSLPVWKTALNSFDFVRTKLREGQLSDKFNEYVLGLTKPHFQKLDFKDAKHVDKLFNIEIARSACSLDLDSCVNEAKKYFNESKYNELPDVQDIILCTAVRHLNVWDKVFEKYSTEADSALKVMYISALGCTKNKTEAEMFLAKTLEEKSNIRSQDRTFVLSSVYNGNSKHIDLVFKFIENNYAKIAKQYGGINPLGRAVVGLAKKLNCKDEYNRLKTLVDKIKNGEEGKAAKDSLENALGIAESNAKWTEKKMDQIRKYLNGGSFVTYSLGLLSLCLFTVFRF